MMPLIIEKLYAWVAEEDDGQQGVIAFICHDGVHLPLIGADMARIESFRSYVEQLAHEHKKKIFLMEFSAKKTLETIGEQYGKNQQH